MNKAVDGSSKTRRAVSQQQLEAYKILERLRGKMTLIIVFGTQNRARNE